MGELPRRRGKGHGLLNAALLTSAVAGALLGLVFAADRAAASPMGFDPLRQSLALGAGLRRRRRR